MSAFSQSTSNNPRVVLRNRHAVRASDEASKHRRQWLTTREPLARNAASRVGPNPRIPISAPWAKVLTILVRVRDAPLIQIKSGCECSALKYIARKTLWTFPADAHDAHRHLECQFDQSSRRFGRFMAKNCETGSALTARA